MTKEVRVIKTQIDKILIEQFVLKVYEIDIRPLKTV